MGLLLPPQCWPTPNHLRTSGSNSLRILSRVRGLTHHCRLSMTIRQKPDRVIKQMQARRPACWVDSSVSSLDSFNSLTAAHMGGLFHCVDSDRASARFSLRQLPRAFSHKPSRIELVTVYGRCLADAMAPDRCCSERQARAQRMRYSKRHCLVPGPLSPLCPSSSRHGARHAVDKAVHIQWTSLCSCLVSTSL